MEKTQRETLEKVLENVWEQAPETALEKAPENALEKEPKKALERVLRTRRRACASEGTWCKREYGCAREPR